MVTLSSLFIFFIWLEIVDNISSHDPPSIMIHLSGNTFCFEIELYNFINQCKKMEDKNGYISRLRHGVNKVIDELKSM